MTPRDGYPSDLSDGRRALIEPVLTAWRTRRRRDALDIGRPPEHDLRSLMNEVLYVDRTGIPWRYLPHDFAPWATVYGYFAKWQQDGVSEELTGLLRRLVRESEGRDGEPPACVLDSQTVKTSANVHLTGQGTDAGKRIIGRKRHLGCDTLGLLLTVLVTAASVSDTAAGVTLPTRIAAAHPHVTKVWADAGHRTTAINHGARLGIDVHPVQRPPGTKGFKIIPRRWTIERSIGRLMHHRRLARDYETHPHRSEATIHLATTDLMTRRLTGETTPNWHGTTTTRDTIGSRASRHCTVRFASPSYREALPSCAYNGKITPAGNLFDPPVPRSVEIRLLNSHQG